MMKKKRISDLTDKQLYNKLMIWRAVSGNVEHVPLEEFLKDANLETPLPLRSDKFGARDRDEHAKLNEMLLITHKDFTSMSKDNPKIKQEWQQAAENWKKHRNLGVNILTDTFKLLAGVIKISPSEIASAAQNFANTVKDYYGSAYDTGTHIGTALKEGQKTRQETRAEFGAQHTMDEVREPDIPEFTDHVKEAVKQGANLKDEGELIALRKQFSSKQNAKVRNHPEWYGKYADLLPNALNFGVRKEADGFDMAIGAAVLVRLVIPQKDGATSQAYKDAIRAIYIKLRGSNSGAFNYDDQDVAAYIECVRGIYALYYALNRDLKLINNLDPYLSKTPEPILAIAGYSGAGLTDLIQNRAQHLIRLNQLAHKIEITCPLPPDMSVFERDKFVSTAVVEEGKGPKSSLFIYNLASVTTVDSGVDLDESNVNGTMTARLGLLENLINRLYNYTNSIYGGQTFVKIAGDMIKAYGEKAFKALPLNSEAEKCPVVHDEYLLNQIQNNNMIQYNDNGFAITSTAAAYAMTYETQIAVNGNNSYTIDDEDLFGNTNNTKHTFVINRNSKNVSNLECISLTRGNFTYKPNAAVKTGTSTVFPVQDCGTDVIEKFEYFYFAEGTNAIQSFIPIADESFTPRQTSMWGQVDFSPMLTAYPANNKAYPLLDLDTYAYCSIEQFKSMNDAAVMSEYKTIGIESQANFKTARSR